MITILLKQIIDLLSGWISSFTQYASDVLEKLGLIEEDTSYLPDIKSDCDDIKDNTAAVITPINNIKSNTDSISTSSATTASNTTAIMNQAVTIGTNSGRAAAFAEDCANNTLDIKDKVVTIASDTTQIRANGNTLVTDIAEIKDLMQYYFLTNIVTEDASGDICNFDTDLEDYLQKVIVEIPADVGGISSFSIYKTMSNIWDEEWELGSINTTTGANSPSSAQIRSKNYIAVKSGKTYYIKTPSYVWFLFYDKDKNVLTSDLPAGQTQSANARSYGGSIKSFTIPNNCSYVRFYCQGIYGTTYNNDISFNFPDTDTEYHKYTGVNIPVSLGSSITDGATVDLLSGMVKIHTTPETYSSITPIAIRTYKGVNNIYSDFGSMEVTYRESLKHYLDKNNQ